MSRRHQDPKNLLIKGYLGLLPRDFGRWSMNLKFNLLSNLGILIVLLLAPEYTDNFTFYFIYLNLFTDTNAAFYLENITRRLLLDTTF
jgi:hypothetical protein